MWITIAICLYFLPTLLSLKRDRLLAIFIWNVCIAWTLVGWFLMMIFVFLFEDTQQFELKIVCKKCDQHYDIPNKSWYGHALICSRCDNYILIKKPWFTWIQDYAFVILFFLGLVGCVIYRSLN